MSASTSSTPVIAYYLIHGTDAMRAPFMRAQFDLFGIPQEQVQWILSPNKGEPIPANICSNDALTQGQVVVTYKHYLALQDIVKKQHPLAVIMEDNICFYSQVPQQINTYLRDLPSGWGCVFDSDILDLHYIEGPTSPGQSVYLKSNEKTRQCDGGSRGANFILINLATATLMYEHFLPFHNVSDHQYNYLLKTLGINSFWAEPPNVHKIPRPSSWKETSPALSWWRRKFKALFA